jgi:hypothetical protein
MAIDDPIDAFEQHYMQEEERSPLAITLFTGKLAFPKAALPLEIFRKVADRFTGPSLEERLQAMWKMLVMETEHLGEPRSRKPGLPLHFSKTRVTLSLLTAQRSASVATV